MEKPIKPILFAAIILVATVSALYTLNLLDQVVNGLTYTYGYLQFDLRWANPYWNLLHITQILLGVIVASTAVNVVFIARKYASMKKQSVKMTLSEKQAITATAPTRTISPSTRTVPLTMHTVEKTSTTPAAPSATLTPHLPQASSPPSVSTLEPPSAPTPLSSEIPGLTRCSHCGKAFTQPLRMLDFQGDRPRIVNICPFCNEIIPSSPRQDKSEQEKKFQSRKKNNNHTPKTLASQPTS